MKKHLSRQEEFDIMKLVLDKFLWLGVFIIGLGFYKIVNSTTNFAYSFAILLAGVIVLIVFMILVVREYEFMK